MIFFAERIVEKYGFKNIDYIFWKRQAGKTEAYNFVLLRKIKTFISAFWHSEKNKNLKIKKTDILVIARTSNQVKSLSSCLDSFSRNNFSTLAVTGGVISRKIIDSDPRYFEKKPTFFDVFKSVVLSLKNELSLKEKSSSGGFFEDYVDFFRRFQVYLALNKYFKLLGLCKPKYLIVANDHSLDTRAATFAANELSIETVYVQHASVTSKFPSLNFSYSFLDGWSAYEVYKKIEKRRPENAVNIIRRQVYLSGQKKKLQKKEKKNGNQVKNLGFAVNTLDNFTQIAKLLYELLKFECDRFVLVRLHPTLNLKKVSEEILLLIPDSSLIDPDQIQFHSASDVSLHDFFQNIDVLVSGNSSIHLEAALSRVITIYYEFGVQEIYDYYGYVSCGLAIPATDSQDVERTLYSIFSDQITLNENAIKKYSRTYGTCWEGFEGDLVVRTLTEKNKKFPFESYLL